MPRGSRRRHARPGVQRHFRRQDSGLMMSGSGALTPARWGAPGRAQGQGSSTRPWRGARPDAEGAGQGARARQSGRTRQRRSTRARARAQALAGRGLPSEAGANSVRRPARVLGQVRGGAAAGLDREHPPAGVGERAGDAAGARAEVRGQGGRRAEVGEQSPDEKGADPDLAAEVLHGRSVPLRWPGLPPARSGGRARGTKRGARPDPLSADRAPARRRGALTRCGGPGTVAAA